MQHIILLICVLPCLGHFSTLCHKRYDLRDESYGTQNVFLFPLQLSAKTFLIGIRAKHAIFLSNLNETRIFSRDFF